MSKNFEIEKHAGNEKQEASSRSSDSPVRMREPRIEDAADIWRLIKQTGVLDLNSSYSYLLLCKFFSDTCVVAEQAEEIVGFVSAFRPPNESHVIFVWQVAVAESQRGKKLATTLLKELLNRETCENVNFLEATISPSNSASQALFKGLAKDLGVECKVLDCFDADLFPESGHEAEEMYKIGPLKK